MPPRKKGNDPPPSLHELEAEVMDDVWRRGGETTVREVLEALNKGPKQRAYTTVMTIMVRLDRKGLLRRKRRGKTDVYFAVIDRDDYREARVAAEVDALVEEFGDVALARFVRQTDKLDPGRVKKLRRLAE